MSTAIEHQEENHQQQKSAASESDNDDRHTPTASDDGNSHKNNNDNKNNNKNSDMKIPSPPPKRKNDNDGNQQNAREQQHINNNKNKTRTRHQRKFFLLKKRQEKQRQQKAENGNNGNNNSNNPLPFAVENDAQTNAVKLPIEAFTPRENPAEEKRRLELLELYWNNSNPSLAGLFSQVDPIDRILAKTHGGEQLLVDGLRQSVFLQDLPRSHIQRKLDALSTKSETERQKSIQSSAKRALQRIQNKNSDNDDENGGNEKEEQEANRKKKEKQMRTDAQDQRREDLRARFFAGEDIGLSDKDKIRVGGPGARQAVARGGVAKNARDMKDAAAARRKNQMDKKMEEERERQRRAAKERAQRDAESAVDRERREYLAEKRAEREAQRKAEEERQRKALADEAEKRNRKALAARQAAQEKADAEAKRKAEDDAQKEYEKALQRKKSMAHPEPKYKFDGPEGIDVTARRVYDALDDGRGELFRVVETDPSIKGKRWHFYNDTDRITFYVRITFVPPHSVRPLGESSIAETDFDGDEGAVVVSVKVPPLKTVAFCEGQVKGFSAEIEAEDAVSSAEASGSFGDDQEGQVPIIIPIFKNGAPEGIDAPYEVYECFENEGLLFRIVKRNPDTGVQQWWYYNDDAEFGFKINVKFGPKSEVETLGAATKEVMNTGDEDDGKFLVKSEVGSLATIPFIKGHPRGFTQDFDLILPKEGEDGEEDALSPERIRVDRKKKLNSSERKKLVKDLQNRAAEMTEQFRQFVTKNDLTANPTDETKRLILAMKNRHFFIDLQFPPIMDSVSLDDDHRDGLSELCWMKPEDFLPDEDEKQQQQQAVGNKKGGAAGSKNALAPAPPAGKKGAASPAPKKATSSPLKSTSPIAASKTATAQVVKALPVSKDSIPEASDIVVGAISDWWILGSISVLAHTPSRITNLFKHHPLGPAVEKKEVAEGIFRVGMLVGGWWQDVVVDDWLPVEIDKAGHPSLFFATSKKGPQELWVSLLEKAVAKTSSGRCYTDLGMGECLQVLEDFTGFPSVRLDPRLEEEDDDAQVALFKDFTSYLERSWIVVLNTAMMPEDDDEADRLQDDLAKLKLEMDCPYRVLATAEFFDHLGTPRRLVKVSNPFGTGKEWKGAWSWGDKEWKRTPAAAKACAKGQNNNNSRRNSNTDGANNSNKKDGDEISISIPMIEVGDSGTGGAGAAVAAAPSARRKSLVAIDTTKPDEPGSFWMEWKDIKTYFPGAGVCYVENDWHDYRVKGRFENGHPSVCLEVRCYQPTRAYLLLMQAAEEDFDEQHPDARYTGAVLSVCSRNEGSGEYESVLNSDIYFDKPSVKDYTFVVGRALGCETTFQPDDQMHLIIPRSYSKTANKEYVLAVILDQPVGEESISFRFKQLDPSVAIFENYPSFSYSASAHSKEVPMDFQYRPPKGRPQTNIGFELEGAPSDLVAGRSMSRMQGGGGATPNPSTNLFNGGGGGGGGGAAVGFSSSFVANHTSPGEGSMSLNSHAGSNSMVRPVSSMSFEMLTDVLIHIRDASKLPGDVNAIGIYDFRGIEVFRTTKLLDPASNSPSWSHFDVSEPGGTPLSYIWNMDNRNLTFKLLYVQRDEKTIILDEIDQDQDPANNSTTSTVEETTVPMYEGKTTWDDATVAAKLSNAQDGNRPIVALRLRPCLTRTTSNLGNLSSTNAFAGSATSGLDATASGGNSNTKRDVVGTIAISFSAVTRVAEESQADYFDITFTTCSRTASGTATKLRVINKKSEMVCYESGETSQATPKIDMFPTSKSECVLLNNRSTKGFVFQLCEVVSAASAKSKENVVVLAEIPVSVSKLVQLSGNGSQKIEMDAINASKFLDSAASKPFIECKIQALRCDN